MQTNKLYFLKTVSKFATATLALAAIASNTAYAFGLNDTPVATKTCADKKYRDENPVKCMFFANTATIAGGASIIGGAAALVGLAGGSSGGNGGSSATHAPVMPTMVTTHYNMVGADIDTATLAGITSSAEYSANLYQYEDIRLAYSLARDFTGRGTTIAVLDSDTSYWHGAAVASIASGAVAPNATVNSYSVASGATKFISYNEIGNIIANIHDANVFNASWSVSMPATDIHSRNDMVKYTDENFVRQITNAATQRDAIFVWAAGNDGMSQSSALSAMPRVIPELNGHFINVVAWDSETGSIADYSNACGVTKNYCITAPGSNIANTETKRPVSGTSFAAPIVSAAVAVLREAHPYMTSSQITDLLFTTARDLGEPGVDDVYGWGMLDMERATRPVGVALVPIDNGRTMQPLQTARVAAPIAHAIKSANVQFAFFDAYGRPFQTALSENIHPVSVSRAFEFLRDGSDDKKMTFGPFELGFAKKEFLLGDGLLKLQDNATTNFVGMRGNLHWGQIEFFGNTRVATMRPRTADESMISEISNVYTASVKTGVKMGDVSASVALPDAIISGQMRLHTPVGRNNQGQIIYTDSDVDLVSRPAVEYALGYKFVTMAFVDNPYGTDELYIVAKGKIKF
ncbi:MAG: S8 family serine peptidase [Alphaproteobacteria bacterium]|nr:S8 family serine peptidase [Alphaproteobacteria bacterium]